MRLAVMQPYFFPYVGYFQLIGLVDKFVFYDDVNYIKNGWINRNRILTGGQAQYLTVPLAGASPFQKINEVMVANDKIWRKKSIERLRHSYAKAPFFSDVNELVCNVLAADEVSIAALAKKSVVDVSEYLGLGTQFVDSSVQYGNSSLTGQSRVIDICRLEGARTYTNPPGGKDLYDAQQFAASGVELRFLQPALPPYPQFADDFVTGLSIIDVLMFNDKRAVRDMLELAKDA
jgi:hypothetical protein